MITSGGVRVGGFCEKGPKMPSYCAKVEVPERGAVARFRYDKGR